MNPVALNVSDVRQHVVKIGLDVYPQIKIADERTRLNMFAEEAIQRFPHLFQRLLSGSDEFKVSRLIAGSGGKGTTTIDTLTITSRGPVFTFPLAILTPSGDMMFEAAYRDDFRSVHELFFSFILGHQVMRIGLVRELLFGTGKASCLQILTSRQSFADADLRGGELLLAFQDPKHNVRIKTIPAQLMQAERMPVGAMIQKPIGQGLQVIVDVNSRQLRPLGNDDMEEVLERADGLWPEKLLEFLCGGCES